MKVVGFYRPQPIDAPDSLLDIDVPTPELRAHDLLVRIDAISVNPVDVKLRARAQPPDGQPRILGYDAVGVVEATGPEARLFGKGDAVFYAGAVDRPGTYAQLQAVDERIVGHRPRSIDAAHAAALPLTSITAWELLFDRLKVPYDVTENFKGGPDGGVDLVLTKGGSTYLVRCKHWKAWSVGAQVVRELKGVMTMRSAAGGFVVTSGKFTREAAEFALKAGIELLDGNELIAFVRGTRAEGLAASPQGSSVGCPRCGGVMVLKTARRGRNAGGQFWGCPRYPVCKGTRAA